ncbi:MAG TPA: rod shape-determining protein RodA, partial [Trebonia sp.]
MSGTGFGSPARGLAGVRPLGGGTGTAGYRGTSGRGSLGARWFAKDGLLRRYDWYLILVTLVLAGFGTVLIWAATASSLRQAGLNPHSYLDKQLLNVGIGVVLMFAVASIDYRRLRAWAPLAYGVTLLLLLAVATPVGTSVNGAKAWIALPAGFEVEPSEYAKLAIIVSAAALLSRRPGLRGRSGEIGVGKQGPGRASVKDVLWAGLAGAPLIGLVALEPALGVTMVLVFVLAGMVVVSGLRLRWIVGALVGLAASVYAMVGMHLLKGYQSSRLTAFLHPQQDLAGAGYNLLQAKTAIGSGGMFGVGLFRGTFTGNNFVPEQQTDFIFTVVGEELGFVGCAVIIVLLALLVLRAIRIAFSTDDLFGMLVAAGVAMWFIFQSFVNIGMTIGLMPITGLPLPFVSYGGSATFAGMIAVGL